MPLCQAAIEETVVVDLFVMDNMLIAIEQIDLPFGEQDAELALQYAPDAATAAIDIDPHITAALSPRGRSRGSTDSTSSHVQRKSSIEEEHELKNVIMDLLIGLMVMASTTDIRLIHSLNKMQVQPEAVEALKMAPQYRSEDETTVPDHEIKVAWGCLREEKARACGLLTLQVMRASLDLPLTQLTEYENGIIAVKGFRFLNGAQEDVMCYLSVAHCSKQEHKDLMNVLLGQFEDSPNFTDEIPVEKQEIHDQKPACCGNSADEVLVEMQHESSVRKSAPTLHKPPSGDQPVTAASDQVSAPKPPSGAPAETGNSATMQDGPRAVFEARAAKRDAAKKDAHMHAAREALKTASSERDTSKPKKKKDIDCMVVI